MTENEKTEAALKKGIDKMQLFYFIHLFPFRLGNAPKWPKYVQKMQNFPFLYSLGPEYKT